MKLICYPTSGSPPEMRPAPASRAWLEATPQGFACRCLPLLIANSHGWEVLSPCEFTAVWDGTVRKEAIELSTPSGVAMSHFGCGILTFHVNALFRTEPGMNLWVTGPTNRPKDGIAALSAIVETDWSPYTFTMNWLFTRPHHPITFVKGEPFCFFFPIARYDVETTEPEIRAFNDDPIGAEHRAWSENRGKFNADLNVPGSDAVKAKWQKTYYRGLKPSGEPFHEHQIKLRVKPFKEQADAGR